MSFATESQGWIFTPLKQWAVCSTLAFLLSLLCSVTSANTTLLTELMLPAAKARDHGTPGTHASPLTSDSLDQLPSHGELHFRRGSCAVLVQSDSYLLVCCGEGTTQVWLTAPHRQREECWVETITLHSDTPLFTIIKMELQGLERGLSSLEHLLLLERTWVWLPDTYMAAHTVHSSSSRGFNTLFGHSQAPGIPCCRHTCKQTPLHIHPKRDQTGSSMRRNLLCGLKHSIKCTTSNSDFLIQVFIKITAETQALSSNTHFLGETNP